MSEYPILFKGAMVRAIFNDTKTQTRRIIKLPKWSTGNWDDFEVDGLGKPQVICRHTGCFSEIPSPYGVPGNKIWVRETWGYVTDTGSGIEWLRDRPHLHSSNYEQIKNADAVIWLADGNIEWTDDIGTSTNKSKWKPSIHMPRWACRIELENLRVRVQRIQDISEEDCIAEGIETFPYGGWKNYCIPDYICSTPYESFYTLWESINAKPRPIKADKKIIAYESFPFDGDKRIEIHRGLPHYIYGNPYVFVIEFKRIT